MITCLVLDHRREYKWQDNDACTKIGDWEIKSYYKIKSTEILSNSSIIK